MGKKVFSCCICLMLLLGLIGCADDPAPTEAMPTAFTTAAPASDMSEEEQIALIVRCKWQWQKTDFGFTEPLYYTVTDLDQNGRLELLVSMLDSSALAVTTEVWEVSADFNSMLLCQTGHESNYLFVDIAAKDMTETQAELYRMDGRCYYVFSDNSYLDNLGNMVERFEVSLENGVITQQSLGRTLTQFTQDDEMTLTYFDSDGKEVSPEVYAQLEAERYAQAQPLTVTFFWHAITERRFTQLSDAELEERFEQSRQGFVIE